LFTVLCVFCQAAFPDTATAVFESLPNDQQKKTLDRTSGKPERKAIVRPSFRRKQ
jgi:hypothetical protein